MGKILSDAGLIVDGKVPDAYFKSYVNDVIKMLQSGKGIFPDSIPCGKEVKPNKAAQDLDLNDKVTFPEFHKIWRPRFEKMVLSLNAESDFQLAKKGLVPFIDPSALAVLLGVSPPDLDLKAILLQMATSYPPPMTPDYLTINFPTLALESPTKLLEMIAALVETFADPRTFAPIPPLPTIPNPILLDFGYTEQFKFELDLGLAPIASMLELMNPVSLAVDLPGIIAGGDFVGGLIEFMCKKVSAGQPESMSTSDVEIAAQKVLQQYQVKYQIVSFVGQSIGSGTATKAIATTLLADAGFETVEENKFVGEFSDLGTGSNTNSLREDIGEEIIGVVGNEDLGKFTPIGASDVPGAEREKLDKVTQGELDAAKAAARGQTGETVVDYANTLLKMVVAPVKTAADLKAENAAKVEVGVKDTEKQLKDVDKRFWPAQLQDMTPAQIALRKQISSGFTTCGLFVGQMFQRWMAKKLITGRNGATYKSLAGMPAFVGGMGSGALVGYMLIGLILEQKVSVKKGKIWVNVDPGSGANVNAIKNATPKKCDIIIELAYLSSDPRGDTAKELLEKGIVPGNDAQTKINQDKIKASEQFLQAKNADIAGGPKPKQPWEAEVHHVCFFWRQEKVGAHEYWITIDGGQGSPEDQLITWKRKKIIRDPKKGVLMYQVNNDGSSVDDRLAEPTTENGTTRTRTRYIGGWLNIDNIPELTEEIYRSTHTQVQKDNLKNAPPPKPADAKTQ